MSIERAAGRGQRAGAGSEAESGGSAIAAPAARRPLPAGGTPEADRLREACAKFEAVFMQQMMKALRETIPREGVVDGGAAEDIFSGLLDDQLSGIAASGTDRGIGDALYRELSALLRAERASEVQP